MGFYFGQLVELDEWYEKGSSLFEEIVKLQEKYGEIFKLQLFDSMMVVVLEPNAIKVKLNLINLKITRFIFLIFKYRKS